ncbi:nuclear transport factor 2 family protein [Chloroflexota bacterium]
MIGAILAAKSVRAAFESLNQRDVAQFLSGWDEDAVFVYPGDLSVSGEFRGKAAIEAWFRGFLEQFPRFQFTVKSVGVDKIFDLTGTNVVAAQWVLTLTNRQGKELQNRGVTVIALEKGRGVHIRDYLFDQAALREGWGE